MECRDAQFYMRFRRAGADELGPELAVNLDGHLAPCPHCAADALSATRFDTAIGAAMRSVEIPVGLRSRLITRAAVQRGVTLRRTALRYSGIAAVLLLTFGLYLGFNKRPEPATEEWVNTIDEQISNPERFVQNWLAEQKLPTELPQPFDYSLLMNVGIKKLQQGQDVPFILFRERQNLGRAEVLILREDQYNLDKVREAQTSNARALVIPMRSKGIVYIIIYTGTDLGPFLKKAGDQV